MTNSQEIFCRNVVQGKTQRESLVNAFPKAKQWKKSTIDVRASLLMKNKDVQAKIIELRKEEEKNIQWNKKIATEKLLNLLELNKKSLQEIEETYEQEIYRIEQEISELKNEYEITNNIETKKKLDKLLTRKFEISIKPRVNIVNSNTILNIIKELNKMYGLYNVKKEIQLQDEERENLQSLSIDELKEIAYANIINK